MRSPEDVGQERPAPWPAAGDQRQEPLPDGEHAWVQGPQTPAERAAARRRLDRLAEGFR